MMAIRKVALRPIYVDGCTNYLTWERDTGQNRWRHEVEHDCVSARGHVLLYAWLVQARYVRIVHTTGLLSQSCYHMDDYYYYTESPRGLSSRSFVPNESAGQLTSCVQPSILKLTENRFELFCPVGYRAA